MPETPQAMAARVHAIFLSVQTEGTVSVKAVEFLDRYVHAVADEYDRLNASLTDEFGILDDGKPMEIDGKSQVLLLNADQVRVALEVRAKDAFAAESRRPARLMQRLVTGWKEIPGDGARGEREDAHSCDNCLGVDPDTCLYYGEKES